MCISDFHSHENFSINYCCNTYEREKWLSLSKEVEKQLRVTPESVKDVPLRCQTKRPLYISVKRDNLIVLQVSRFSGQLVTSTDLSLEGGW